MLAFLRKLNSGFQKAILMFLVYSFIFIFFASFFQKGTPANIDHQAFNKKILSAYTQDPGNNDTWEEKFSMGMIRTMNCIFVGELCKNGSTNAKENFDKSILGMVSNLIVLPYANPPASGVYTVYSGLENAGFTPKVHAAGIGFHSLGYFQPYWKAFRNVAYIVLVLFIVTIGFLIMFRVKINPQTVVTLENSLPRIILTLLFITFSFAIAGFLVDITYIAAILVLEVFSTTDIARMNPQHLQDHYIQSITGGGFFSSMGLGFSIYMEGLNGLYAMMPPLIKAMLSFITFMLFNLVLFFMAQQSTTLFRALFGEVSGSGGVSFVVSAGVTLNLGSLVAAIIGLLGSLAIAGLLIYGLFFIVVMVGLLFLYFRIFFLLIGSYVQLVIQIIFAPLLILPNAIPGQNSFFTWIKKVVGYLAVFPIILFFLTLVESLYQTTPLMSACTQGAFDLFQPEACKYPAFTLPLLQSFDTRGLVAVVTAALLLKIPDFVKATIKPLIGESTVGAGSLFGGVGSVGGKAWESYRSLATLTPYVNPDKAVGKLVGRIGGVLGMKVGGK